MAMNLSPKDCRFEFWSDLYVVSLALYRHYLAPPRCINWDWRGIGVRRFVAATQGTHRCGVL